MRNTGEGHLQVPGFNDVPLCFEFPNLGRNIDLHTGFADWSQDPRLTAREVAMMRFMEAVTEEPGWERRVTDQTALENWPNQSIFPVRAQHPGMGLVSGRATRPLGVGL